MHQSRTSILALALASSVSALLLPANPGRVAKVHMTAKEPTHQVVTPPTIWPSRSWARRGFYHTDYGSIHYVYGGDFSTSAPTLAFFHMNPRSTADFEQTIELLHADYSFVAFDYFGQGHSDDDPRSGSNAVDTDFVSAGEFASYAVAIMDSLSVDQFVPIGASSGSGIALNLAALLPQRVASLVLINSIWYYPEVAKNVKKYMNPRSPPLAVNGSHLIDAWKNINGQPTFNGPRGQPTLQDLALQESKTVDVMRSRTTQWQYIMMYLTHNENEKIAQLQALSSRVLVVWGSLFIERYDSFGMRVTDQRSVVEGAIRNKDVLEIDNCAETIGTQNAPALAAAIRQLVDRAQ